MSGEIPQSLKEFSYIPSAWLDMLIYLENLIIKENWKFLNIQADKRNQQNPILENYIYHTYGRLATERNSADDEDVKNSKVYIDEDRACFNTGLFTKNYKYVYTYFERNNRQESDLKWVLKGFFDDSSPELIGITKLPTRAEYFTDISDLIYDTKLELRVNSAHILDNPLNRERIPESVRNLPTLPMFFDGAVNLAKKKIEANYKVAVPQYYQGKIQFLLPICLLDMEKVDLALAVTKQNGYYIGHTCLTLDMAYNNARLIAKPGDEWLNP